MQHATSKRVMMIYHLNNGQSPNICLHKAIEQVSNYFTETPEAKKSG
jgi:hypothetical protein